MDATFVMNLKTVSMKKIACFLSILLLFQSCYSYKTFDLKNYPQIKPKKVKIELLDSKIIKGKIINIENEEIFLKTISKTKNISISEIKKIKKREFSLLKTSLLGGVISISLLFIVLNLLLKGVGNAIGVSFP